jgi:hypothetical protein
MTTQSVGLSNHCLSPQFPPHLASLALSHSSLQFKLPGLQLSYVCSFKACPHLRCPPTLHWPWSRNLLVTEA